MDNSPSLDESERWLEEALAATRAQWCTLHTLAQAVASRIETRLAEAQATAARGDALPNSASGDGSEALVELERLRCLRRRLDLAAEHADLAVQCLLPAADGVASGRTSPEEGYLAALEEEHYRLARDIHDGPAQVLANAILELQYCERLVARDPAALPAELAELKASLRGGLAEVRRLIFDLHPPALVELGLAASLQRYGEELRQRSGLAVTVAVPETEERLSPAQEVAVFRIVQEALQNVRKHAHATRVSLRLECTPEAWRVSIADDGIGFTPELAAGARRHLGLTSMRERAQAIGARLELASVPGNGTTVTVTVPRRSPGVQP